MIRILSLLAGLALFTAGCSGLALQQRADEEPEAFARQLQARQVIVTLAPATPQVWATLAKELSGDYGLISRRFPAYLSRRAMCCFSGKRKVVRSMMCWRS